MKILIGILLSVVIISGIGLAYSQTELDVIGEIEKLQKKIDTFQRMIDRLQALIDLSQSRIDDLKNENYVLEKFPYTLSQGEVEDNCKITILGFELYQEGSERDRYIIGYDTTSMKKDISGCDSAIYSIYAETEDGLNLNTCGWCDIGRSHLYPNDKMYTSPATSDQGFKLNHNDKVKRIAITISDRHGIYEGDPYTRYFEFKVIDNPYR